MCCPSCPADMWRDAQLRLSLDQLVLSQTVRAECCRARSKRDGTCAETRFGLSAKRTSPFKSAGGRQFSRLLAAEVCASAVVMVVMLDTACSEVECKATGYPLHSDISPSLPLPCATVCHQVSTELYCQLLRPCHFELM